MKNLINKVVARVKDAAMNIVEWLNTIAKDEYQHFAVGVVTSAVALVIAMPLGAWWQWIPLLVSIIAAVMVNIDKERKIDPKADMQDILWTLGGSAVAWLVYIAYILF